MEENKIEEVVDETTEKTNEQAEEKPQAEKTKKPNINESGDYVVDLTKPKEDETKKFNQNY